MPIINAGATSVNTVAGDQTVLIITAHGSEGRFTFVPANTSNRSAAISRSFGPQATNITYGPFGQAGTLTVFADVGSVDFTVNSSVFQNVSVVAAATVSGTLTVGTFAQTGAGAFTSTSTGAKTLTSTTGNVVLGATTTGLTTLTQLDTLTATNTNTSGTPGNATINTLSGRAAFAAAASTCVITNSKVTATSRVFVSLSGGDATLTSVRVTPAAGSFTVTGNAAATGVTVFDFFVVN